MASPDSGPEEQGVAAIISSLAVLDESLMRPPSLVLVGERNVGKSSIANCLLGRQLLPTSIIENTPTPILLRHAPTLQIALVMEQERRVVDSSQLDAIVSGNYDSLEIGLPAERLRSLEILDTPGEMGVRWLGGSVAPPDTRIVAWCTLATQAWKESERRAWTELPPELVRDAILIVTNKDQLASEDDARSVQQRLATATRGLFRRIVFVNARRPMLNESLRPDLWRRDSGIAELEAVLLSRLIKMRRRRLRKTTRVVQRLHRLVHRQFPST